jgi:hypothetical protein
LVLGPRYHNLLKSALRLSPIRLRFWALVSRVVALPHRPLDIRPRAIRTGSWRALSARLPGLVSRIEPVAGSELDFDFVQFVPFGVGAIPLRDGPQFPQTTTRICRSRQIARRIAWRKIGWSRLSHGRLCQGRLTRRQAYAWF